MTRPRAFSVAARVCLGVLLLPGCERSPAGETARAAAAAAPAPFYTRELIFMGEREGTPLVSALVLRVRDEPTERVRGMRGWLARGRAWDLFLEERWRGGRVGSAWTLVPRGDLRLAAGGAAETEALWYRRGARHLRMQIERRLTAWDRGPSTGLRLHAGDLRVGGETTRGMVLEFLRVRTPERAATPEPEQVQLLLTAGDSLRILLADTPSAPAPQDFAWVSSPDGEGEWGEVEIVSGAEHPLAEARRDVPRAWSVRVPGAGITGRVRALGSAAEIGMERGGRRAVEIRYTVEGWVEQDGRRARVVGVLRHSEG